MPSLFQRYASLPKPHAQVRPLNFAADVVEVSPPATIYGRDVRDIFAVLPSGAISPQVGARFVALDRTFAWKSDAQTFADTPQPVEVPRLDVRFLGRLRPDGFSPAAGWVEIQQ